MGSSLSIVDLEKKADALAARIKETRRVIHRDPELGLETPRTQQLVAQQLARIGVGPVDKGGGCTSVVAEIEGSGPGPGAGRCVALRADMDALPLEESSGEDWASGNPGCMHACGHDAHIAMLLGAAEILHANRDCFAGTVRLLFQPGEEGFGGASVMIKEGALEGVDAAFAIHVDSSQPPGLVRLREGPILASADVFVVTFKGEGGHASMPHLARDPIPAIGPFVDGLSHAVARETDPEDRVVMTVAQVKAGTTLNVIPPTAECLGTIRALSEQGRAASHARLIRIAEGVAAARGLEVDAQVLRGYPPTVNHGAQVSLAAAAAAAVGLEVSEMAGPVMGAEDFSYVLEKVPGALVFLGCHTAGGGPLHSDLMKLDESVLPRGASLHVAAALTLLADQ